MKLNWVARCRTTVIRWVPPVLYAVLVTVLAGGCANVREGASASGISQPTERPWALPTATMRWNEYACELIARNQIGQFPAARTLAYTNLAINNAIVVARQQGHGPDGAAAAAVLAYVFPKEEPAIAGRLSGEMAALGPAGPRADFAAGCRDRACGGRRRHRCRQERPVGSPVVRSSAHRRRQVGQPVAAASAPARSPAG